MTFGDDGDVAMVTERIFFDDSFVNVFLFENE